MNSEKGVKKQHCHQKISFLGQHTIDKKVFKQKKTWQSSGLFLLEVPDKRNRLLNFYFSTSFFQLLAQGFSFVLSYTFLHWLGGRVNQLFSFLQTKTR